MPANPAKPPAGECSPTWPDTIDGISYSKESERGSGKDKVELVVVQHVRRTGTASTRGMPVTDFRHKAELRRSGASWKVYAFDEQMIEQ